MNDDQFEQALADVDAGRGPASVRLAGLSHLAPEQVTRFARAWEGLAENQKLALIEALSRQEFESMRLDFNAIYYLGMADQRSNVRRAAIRATLEDTSLFLLGRLLALLEDDEAVDVRLAAARGLEPFAQLAELGEFPSAEAERLRRVLFETIRRPDERIGIRAAALGAVGYFSGEQVRAEIEALSEDDAFRLEALRAMGHSADATWLPRIMAAVDDPDDAIRLAAVRAAGEIGDASAVRTLTDAIDAPALQVRLAAIAALGEIGGSEARESLIYALQDEDQEIRQAAESALGELDFFDDPMGA